MNCFKKILTTCIVFGLSLSVIAAEVCPQAVRSAIERYKAKDYVGCVQDLEEYSEEDPSNAIAYYYTGIAYMKLGMKDQAVAALEKVSTINSIPILSSYAIQATMCMNKDISPCVYKKYSTEEIEEMVADASAFFEKKLSEKTDKAQEVAAEDTEDIDKLIHGIYPENIHPDANKVIQQTRLIQEQERVNAELNKRSRTDLKPDKKNKSDAGTDKTTKLASSDLSDKEIADAVRTLSKAGYKFTAPEDNSKNNQNQNINPYKQMAAQYALQDDAAQMALMFGDNSRSKNNSFDMMIPFLLMQEQQNSDGSSTGKKLNPELIKTMMMNQMMGDFDFGFDNKDK